MTKSKLTTVITLTRSKVGKTALNSVSKFDFIPPNPPGGGGGVVGLGDGENNPFPLPKALLSKEELNRINVGLTEQAEEMKTMLKGGNHFYLAFF